MSKCKMCHEQQTKPLSLSTEGWCSKCCIAYAERKRKEKVNWEAIVYGDRHYYLVPNKEAATEGFLAGFDAGFKAKKHWRDE